MNVEYSNYIHCAIVKAQSYYTCLFHIQIPLPSYITINTAITSKPKLVAAE